VSDELSVRQCSSCHADIVWLLTAKGKRMPVDAATVKPGDYLFEPNGEHVSHFATCPSAQQHRRGRRAP
jgi:hypothetical protein